ncbi:hypothetical protein [[Mycobacterium] burgundiense]|uniref:Uncharacterized protein n=1 Tax=[Mycobacterium] burgundiense TaxID=3064286 RepID=A0ABM9LYW9_9MYCO|nr:hypothetical protein [Mycolicibacterium sp. MU0053]CAJ1507134.1 hypothetical protein MU0053_003410 [Mycolicibacterium sp. MU0053]
MSRAASRQTPTRRPAELKDLTLLVTVPGDPQSVRVFTDAESDDANTYAAETGGQLTRLPR